MKKISLPLATLILIGAIAQPSFSLQRTPPTDPVVIAAMKKAADAELPIIDDTHISIDIAAKKQSFYGGEPVEIEITLKNSGTSKTRLLKYPVERFYDFEVIGFGTPSMPRNGFVNKRFAGSIESFDLGKTRSQSASIILNNAYDMSLAGTYKIKVSKRFRFQDITKKPVTISSNILTVDVTSELPLSSWH